jgi:hypothetical protein
MSHVVLPEHAPLVLAVEEEVLGLLLHLTAAAYGDHVLPGGPTCEEVPTALFLPRTTAWECLCQRTRALPVHVRAEDRPVDPRSEVVGHALLWR